MSRLVARPRMVDAALGAVPFTALAVAWLLAPMLIAYPPYMLPSIGTVIDTLLAGVADGSLLSHVVSSLTALGLAFLLGNAVAIPLGIAIALDRNVRETAMPTVTFLQSIGGVAWVPLALIWFGIGYAAVIFVIANTIFFGTIYSTIVGIRSVPMALRRSAATLGASRLQILVHVLLPGAFVQILLGLRTSMAFGWRALVAGEMIAGANGLGYITIEAVQWYKTEIIIMGMLLIGTLWLIMDRWIFTQIENATIRRWGIVRDI